MNQSTTMLINSPSGQDATPVTPAAVTVQPTPRVVFANGELLIDGVAVCPTCLEDKGSKFCPCSPDDLIRELGLAVLREQRAEMAS